MTLHELGYLRPDHVSVSKNSDMLTAGNREKLNIRNSGLVHFSVHFKLHQPVFCPMNNQNRHVQVF